MVSVATSDPWHLLFSEFCRQFYCEPFGWASCLQQEGEAQRDLPPLLWITSICYTVAESHYCCCCWAGRALENRRGRLWDSLMTPGEGPEEGYHLGEAIVKMRLCVSCKKWKNAFLSALLEEAVPEFLGYLYEEISIQCVKYLGTLGIFFES